MNHSNDEALNALFNLSKDLLCAADLQGSLVLVNPAFTEILGWEPYELIGKSFTNFFHEEDVEKIGKALKQFTATGNFSSMFQARYKCKNGGYKWIEWSGSLGKDHIFAVGRDITAKKNAENMLEIRNNELERVNRLMIGREVKMLELKSEIKHLRHELSEKKVAPLS